MSTQILSITTVDNMIKLVGILVTIISTYFVTKYTSNNPKKLEVKEKQLHNVYLPLYKLIRYDIGKPISKENAFKYALRMRKILYNNYEYVYPQLHKLHDSFLLSLQTDADYQSIFKKISYQVSLDYDLLKKSLGYPSENLINLFFRMTLKDKLTTLISWINVFFVLCMPMTLVILFKQFIFKLIIFSFISVTLLIAINRSIKSMKD